MASTPQQDDCVYRFTRLLAVLIIPFLIAASIILVLPPDRTGELFVWPIKPSMTTMLLGAAYLGGVYFWARVALAEQWHTIKAGFPPVILFPSIERKQSGVRPSGHQAEEA